MAGVDHKWLGDGMLEIALLNGFFGRRWVFGVIGPPQQPSTAFYTRFTIVAGVFFIVADPASECRKPLKTLSPGPLITVAERILTAFSSILLIKLWYVPQFDQKQEKTRLAFPEN